MMGYGWGMGAGGWIAMTVFWVALIALIVWLFGRAFLRGGNVHGCHRDESATAETPAQILDRRYASGELDLETYQTMRVNLTSNRSRGEEGSR